MAELFAGALRKKRGQKSKLSEQFGLQLIVRQIRSFEREVRFHPERMWRFDWADRKRKVAVEIEGGAFVGGRHVQGGGFEKDCEKYNEAAILGWRVLRGTSAMVRNCSLVDQVERILKEA